MTVRMRRLIPLLFTCGKQSGTLTSQMVAASFLQLIRCIQTESDPSFLSSLYRAVADGLRVVGIPSLTPDLQSALIEATNHQLHTLADKRNRRAETTEDDREELALLEEVEEFALEDMEKLLKMMDGQHPLLIAISSVRELGVSRWDSEDERDSDS